MASPDGRDYEIMVALQWQKALTCDPQLVRTERFRDFIRKNAPLLADVSMKGLLYPPRRSA